MARLAWERWRSLIVWTVVACVIAGGYGVVHNQVSYTVSPDYFHAFKFHQFRIPPGAQNRWGAAAVGWQAAWWLGLLIGPPLIVLTHRRCRGRVPPNLLVPAFLLVAGVAAVVGLGALGLSRWTIDERSVSERWIPEDVADPVAYVRAGRLHDASYAGGLIGVFAALGSVAWRTRDGRMSPPES